MDFSNLRSIIKVESEKRTFLTSSEMIQSMVFDLKKEDIIPIITEIGSIPEDIVHDSSEEKLYAKVSDIVLAKCFQELGLRA
ncbi:MAG: HindIII family type II restriction endonuclease, partial [Treponema sp.]|nr:HindIII family type II restriction endonuclease [Treponema sp.]